MDGECSICLDTLLIGKNYKLSCGHYFHTQCIDTWFKRTNICPLCRYEFKYIFGCRSIKYKFLKYKLIIESNKIIINGLFIKKHFYFYNIIRIGYIKDCFIIYYKNKIMKYRLESNTKTFELFNILKNKFV